MKATKESNPTYQNAITIVEIFLYLKQFPRGVLSSQIQEEYYQDKDDRTFHRVKKALEDFLFDPQGDKVFFFEGEGKNQTIRLHPKHFNTSDVMEWHLFGLMMSNVMMTNIKGDVDSSPDIKSGVLQLRDLIVSNLEADFYKSNADGEISEVRENLLNKIKKKYYCKKVGQKIYGKDDKSTEILDKITQALYKENKLKIHKYKNEKKKDWVFSPYTLLSYNDAFYVMGKLAKGYMLTLAIDRIDELEVLKKTFNYPKDYHPSEILNKGFGVGDVNQEAVKVELLFDQAVSYLITERFWHHSQMITEKEDGSVLLEMEVPDSFELRKFVLSFGSNVKALAPDSLGQFIKEDKSK
ncbi:MAG: WYL domain-containing protein [Pseudomonadota bacterium]